MDVQENVLLRVLQIFTMPSNTLHLNVAGMQTMKFNLALAIVDVIDGIHPRVSCTSVTRGKLLSSALSDRMVFLRLHLDFKVCSYQMM
jgi:hypothetical protein